MHYRAVQLYPVLMSILMFVMALVVPQLGLINTLIPDSEPLCTSFIEPFLNVMK